MTIINLLIGVVLGYALHRSRFCFAGAFRDYILFRDNGLLKALLMSLCLSTILFSGVQLFYISNGGGLPGNFYPMGLPTILGGIIFGIGMVIAGGCVCSIFLRLGEGFTLFIFVLLGLGLGSLLGASQWQWWQSKFGWVQPVFLGEVIWWPLAVLLQVAALLGAVKYLNYQEKQEKEKEEDELIHVQL